MQTVDFDPTLSLVYSTAADGNMDERFSGRSVVMVNRRKILNQIGLNPRLIIEGKQVHSDRILILNDENTKMWYGNNIPGVDGFVTDQPDLGLVLKVADCVPVVMLDPNRPAFGVFHVGWQGAEKNIHLQGLQAFTDYYNTRPNEIKVWIGPSAKKCCYRSDTDPKQNDNDAWKPFITKEKNGWAIDIPGYIKQTLRDAGVKVKNMTEDKACTVESPDLFSHTVSKNDPEIPEARFVVIAKLR
jgi:YfiH family protein